MELHADHRAGRGFRQLERRELVPERRRINAEVRSNVFAWLDRNGYSYVPSQSNCFMLDTKRAGKEVIDTMAEQHVHIGRIWPVWPTYVRITVGTASEMDQFQTALKKVMTGAVTAKVASARLVRRGRRGEMPVRA